MTKRTRRNSLVVTIPLAAAAAAWIFLVFLPIQRAIDRRRDEANEMRQYCAQAESLLPLLKHTGRDLADVRQNVAYWDQTAPAPRDLTGLLGKITASARSSGLRITRFDPQPIVPYDRIAQMPISMAVTGSFADLFSFLGRVETMPQTIWMERLKTEKSRQVGQGVLCELELVVFMDNPENSDQRNDSDDR